MTNKIAKLLKTLSIILAIVGAIGAFVLFLGIENSPVAFIPAIVVGFLVFVFIRGYAEIVQLLQDIKDKQ